MNKSAKKLAKRFKVNERDTKARLKEFAESIRPDMSEAQIGPAIKSALDKYGWDQASSEHTPEANATWAAKRLRRVSDAIKKQAAKAPSTGAATGPADIILAMQTLAKSTQANKEQARVSERAREQVKGKLKGSILMGLRYLQTAAEAFDNDFDAATKFVKENNAKAKALPTTSPMSCSDYHAFCGAVIKHDHPRLDEAIEHAADNGERQGPGESMHKYIARCEEDHETLKFGMTCATWSSREIKKSLAASIAAAIGGLREELVGDLPFLQKEKVYLGSTLQWDEVRAKAGAREAEARELQADSGSGSKRRKLAPAAVATQGLSAEDIQAAIRTATEEAVRTAWDQRNSHDAGMSKPAPTAAIAPLVQSDMIDAILQGSATATRSAIDEFARSATAMVAQPGPPQQLQQPPTQVGEAHRVSPYKRRSNWPGLCNHCNVVHERFEECPRCICRRCNKQGHMQRDCKGPAAACSGCGSESGQGHTRSCKTKNQFGRRR